MKYFSPNNGESDATYQSYFLKLAVKPYFDYKKASGKNPEAFLLLVPETGIEPVRSLRIAGF
jgi:hypothetical protein